MDDERAPAEDAGVDRAVPLEAAAPSTSDTPPPSPWEAHAAAAREGALQVGSVVGRTLDTFAAGWVVFVTLALPVAVAAGIGSGLYTGSPTLAIVLTVIAGIAGVVAAVAMTVATDDVRAGRELWIGSAVRTALGRTMPVFLLYLAMGIVLVGVIAVTLLVVAATAAGGPAVAVVAAIVGVVLAAYLFIRWSLAVPAVALDGAGPLDALNRSRVATRRNAWRLLGLWLALALLTLPLSLGAGMIAAEIGPIPGTILVVIATVVAAPLGTIAAAVAYGDLTNRPTANIREPLPRRRGAVAGLLVGLGVLLLVPGTYFAASAAAESFADRGRILAGTASNPEDPCRPTGVKSTFSSGEEIYVGGRFTRRVLGGQTVSVAYYVDGELVVDEPLATTGLGIDCYYEIEPLRDAAPAIYRVVLRHDGEIVAEGTFTVQ